MRPFSFPLFLISLALTSCSSQEDKVPLAGSSKFEAPVAPLFKQLQSNETGVQFVNKIDETPQINFYRYQYLYNGGGVAIGDINNDGLSDLYFTGNLVPDKIYLNLGGMKFEDISSKAGIDQVKGWKTGVSMVDINLDGYLDIYVCRSGWTKDAEERKNLLFINQGDLTFKESAGVYGLADAGHSIQSVFFDYDKDGDLDMFLTNHPVEFRLSLVERLERAKNPPDEVRDKIYRNNGNNTFSEVSRQAGIVNYGHGLGPVVSDINKDGWPDIYVANDFQTQDYLYINNGDGTFSDRLAEQMGHVSYFSMGCDIADIDNDLHPDIFVVEMLAEDNKRQKTNMASMDPEKFQALVDLGFHYQFMRNTLQLNNGNNTFSEIAWQAGVTNTDWSWGPLLADFDHDGDKDIVITNGYLHDTQDKDFVNQSNELAKLNNNRLDFQQVTSLLPSTRIRNYAYRYEGDYHFKDVSEEWGFDFKGFSNGVAYGDLDNDGDLDLVINNVNDPALVYENSASDIFPNFLRFLPKGPAQNPHGLGLKVEVQTANGQTQYQEFQTVRGFQSNCEFALHFGLAEFKEAKVVKAIWPDGKIQEIEGLKAGQVIVLKYSDAVAPPPNPPGEVQKVQGFKDVTLASGVSFKHIENYFDDYAVQVLLPHKESQNGPGLAVGDINNDGLDDFYVCGAKDQAGVLYSQDVSGHFKALSGPWGQDGKFEDVEALFFDFDGDSDLDLYVVSGGNEWPEGSPNYQDRLYENLGAMKFSKTKGKIPEMPSSGGVAVAGDMDGDGDQDLFIGGRILPGKYPSPPPSYLLINEGGVFKEATSERAPGLQSPGLVTDAVWADFDRDGDLDLAITGEWMPIKLLMNEGGKLSDWGETSGLKGTEGWWFSLIADDFDGDGNIDLCGGNLGLNYKYQATEKAPFHVYSDDFDGNGSYDIVLGYNNQGTCFPVRGRQCSSEQIPELKEKFPTYEDFGKASIEKVYGEKLKTALHYQISSFESSLFMNEGKGHFKQVHLPAKAQFAPINAIICYDFGGDGRKDLLIAGNLYGAEVETGRADAGMGLFLDGVNGPDKTKPYLVARNGFFAPGDVKDLALIRTGKDKAPIVVIATNDKPLKLLKFEID